MLGFALPAGASPELSRRTLRQLNAGAEENPGLTNDLRRALVPTNKVASIAAAGVEEVEKLVQEMGISKAPLALEDLIKPNAVVLGLQKDSPPYTFSENSKEQMGRFLDWANLYRETRQNPIQYPSLLKYPPEWDSLNLDWRDSIVHSATAAWILHRMHPFVDGDTRGSCSREIRCC